MNIAINVSHDNIFFGFKHSVSVDSNSIDL